MLLILVVWDVSELVLELEGVDGVVYGVQADALAGARLVLKPGPGPQFVAAEERVADHYDAEAGQGRADQYGKNRLPFHAFQFISKAFQTPEQRPSADIGR